MKTVLVIDDTGAEALRDALSDSSFSITTCVAAKAIDVIRASSPDGVVVASLGEASAKFVTHLKKGLPESCPGIIVALQDRDDGLRDQCLIGGAADVSRDGPEDVVRRTDALLNGWIRGTPRKPFKASFRAQRSRQTLSLPCVDIDPTGFTFGTQTNVASGELVRVMLPLANEKHVFWGRVSEADGEPGVRFLGLSADERVSLAGTIKALGDAPVPGFTSSAPSIPVLTPSSALLAVQPKVDSAQVTVLPDPSDDAPGPDVQTSGAPPSVEAAPGVTVEAQITAREPAPETVAASPSPSPAAGANLDPGAAAAPTGASLIEDLIGSVLSEGSAPAAPVAVPVEPEAAPARTWPERQYPEEAARQTLREVLTVGLVSETEGGIPGNAVLAFVRTLSIPEQHLFDEGEQESLPHRELAIRCLVLRLRLFAYVQDALLLPADAPRVEVEASFLATLEAEVKNAGAELQKATSAHLASGDSDRIKDTNQFRKALDRAHDDFRAGLARIRGEVSSTPSGRALLLDAEDPPASGAFKAVRREAARDPDQPKAQPAFNKKKLGRARKSRPRLLIVCTGIVVLAAAFFALQSKDRLLPLSPAEFADLGAKTVNLNDGLHKAVIIVQTGWLLDQHQAQLTQFLTRHKVGTYIVETDRHVLLAFGQPKHPQIKTIAAQFGGQPPGALIDRGSSPAPSPSK